MLYSAEVTKRGRTQCVHPEHHKPLKEGIMHQCQTMLIPKAERSVVGSLSTAQYGIDLCGILYVYPVHTCCCTDRCPTWPQGIPSSGSLLCGWLAGLITEASPQAWHMLHLLEGSDGLERAN